MRKCEPYPLIVSRDPYPRIDAYLSVGIALVHVHVQYSCMYGVRTAVARDGRADLCHARGEGEMEKQEELEVLKSTGCVVLRSRTCSAPPRAPARTP